MQRICSRLLFLCAWGAMLACGDVSSPSSLASLKPHELLAPLPATTSLDVPAGPTSWGGGYGPATVVPVAGGAVARVVARGSLTFSLNTACDPGGWPSAPLAPLGPNGQTNHEGHVSVNLTGDNTFTDWLNYNSGDSLWIVYKSNDGASSRDIIAERRSFETNGICSTGGPTPTYTFWYNVSGSNALTIDVLGVDISLSSETIIQGQPVTATASALNFAGHQISWSYDTAQYKPQIQLPSCANNLTCNYSPTRQGQFRVCMLDEYNFYSICGAANPLSIAAPPTFSCTPNPVQRGSTVNCTVAGSGVAVTSWTFEGPSFDGATIHQIQGPTTGNSWGGTAVMPGVVRAQYSFNGVPQTNPLSTSLAVSSRPWSWSSADWSFTQGTAQPCSTTPFVADSSTLMGWNRRKGTCAAGRITPYPPEDVNGSAYTIAQVTSGLNAGLWYVTGVTYRMETESNLNSSILSSSSVMFQLVDPADKQACKKLGSTVTAVNFYTFNNKCKNINVNDFINALWAHEGFGISNNSGHEAQARIAAALPANDSRTLVEKVFATEFDIRYLVGDQAFQASQRLSAASSSHAYVQNNWCGSIWRYNRLTSKWIYAPVYTEAGLCP
jgi:hypothetical protein